MLILRKYQLDIIFLFFAITIIVWTFFYFIKYFGADPHDYEWFVVGPLLLLYLAYLWRMRKKIRLADRRKLTGKSLVYWILLGISLVATYSTPIPAAQYWSLTILFIAFTLLLADSYWDFRQLTMEKLTAGKKNQGNI